MSDALHGVVQQASLVNLDDTPVHVYEVGASGETVHNKARVWLALGDERFAYFFATKTWKAAEVEARGVARVLIPPPAVGCAEPLFSANGGQILLQGTPGAILDAGSGAILSGPDLGEAEVMAPIAGGLAVVVDVLGRVALVQADGVVREVSQLHVAPTFVVTVGRKILVGDREGRLTEVDADTGATRSLLKTGGLITGLVAQGDTWSASSGDGSVWSGGLDGAEPRLRFQGPAGPNVLSALPDGGLLVGNKAGEVMALESDGAARSLFMLPGPISALAVADHGRLLAATDATASLRVLDRQTGVLHAPPWVDSLALGLAASLEDETIAAVLQDGSLRLWSPRNGVSTVRRSTSKLAGPVAVSPDGRSAASCAMDGSLRIWGLPALEGQVHLGHEGRIFHPIWLPDGRLATDSDDHTVRIWPSGSGEEPMVLTGHTDRVYGLDLSPDGRQVLSTGLDGLAIAWDVQTGASTVLRGHEGRLRFAMWSADGQRMLSGGRDGTLRSWSLAGEPIQVTLAHEGGVHWLTLAEDGRHVLSVGRDRTLRRWDPDTGALETLASDLGAVGGSVLRAFSLPGDRVLTCPDDHSLAVLSPDGSRRVWSVPEEVVCASLVLSPDRRLVAAPAGHTLALIDWASGEWRNIASQRDEIHALAWSPDGLLLATAGLEGSARIWRVSDGAGAIVARSESGLLGVAFSPDGRDLATAGVDQSLQVVPVDEAALIPQDPIALHERLVGLTQARFELVSP